MKEQLSTLTREYQLQLDSGLYSTPDVPHHYIYQITNNLNGKIYIGRRSSPTPPEEDDYMGSGTGLWRAYRKHGQENFTKEILHTVSTFAELCALEAIIVNSDWLKSNYGKVYNMTTGGISFGVHTKEVHERISNSMKNRVLSEEAQLAMEAELERRRGVPLTDAHKERIRSGNTGKKRTPEQTARIAHNNRSRRPWTTRMILKDPTALARYKSLDEIYDSYMGLNPDKRGIWSRLNNHLLKKWGFDLTEGIKNYLKAIGDPRLDSEWVKFKEASA